jgi:hypothetical protein
MASFNSILSDVGNFFKKIFTSKVTQDIETGVEVFAQTPLASLVLGPAGAKLLANGVQAIQNIELASIAAGAQSGTGAQKAAAVAQIIEADYNAFAAAQTPPLPVTPASLAAFVDALVAVANSFPAGTTAASIVAGTATPVAKPAA